MKKNNEKLIKFLICYFSGLMLIRIAVWIWNLPETVNDGFDYFAMVFCALALGLFFEPFRPDKKKW